MEMEMESRPIGRELSRPKLPQLLIALFLVKSRPSNLSIHEHVQSLRAFAKAGRRLEGSSTVHNHIDTSAFWRDAFKKSEETQNELRARVFELEQLLAAPKAPSSSPPVEVTSKKKRKRSATKAADGDGAVALKRPKVAGVEQGNDESLPFLAEDVVKPLSDQTANTFLHHFYILRQLTAQKTPEFKALATALRLVLSDISRIISSSETTANDAAPRNTAARSQRRRSTQTQSNMGQELDVKLTAITRIFPHLLQSLHNLSETSEGYRFQGQVIYSFIEVFRDLLQHIFALSMTQRPRPTPAATSQPTRKPAARAAKQAPAPAPAAPTLPPNKNILKLCNVLLALQASLDPCKRPDEAILEGLLFFLLTRAGTALKIFVFEDSYPEDFLRSPHPTTQTPIPTPNHAIDRHNAESHAPYLIYLLDHLLPPPPTLSRRVSSISIPPSTPPPTSSPPPPARPLLTTLPSSTLQSTLLRAVFGSGSGSGSDSTAFAQALAPPCPGAGREPGVEGPGLALARGEQDVGEWFKAEVWRIVGWGAVWGYIGW